MNTTRDELSRGRLAKDIIGEIVMSDSPESVIKKWRNIFKVSQKMLANELEITPSVVSDYESGRRKSPGIRVIRKYVDTLLRIDMERGGNIIKSFAKINSPQPRISDAIIDIKEFSNGVSIQKFCKGINASFVVKGNLEQEVYGYTIIDSLKAVTELSFNELINLYGSTTQRVLIFTKVSTGKSPMVAIKMTNLHPALVILHGLSVVDEVAKRIAEVEGILLAVCRLEGVDDIINNLKEIK